MTWKDWFHLLERLEINLALVLSGLFGSIAFLSKPNDMTKGQKILTVLSGVGSANYLTPLFLWIFHIPTNFGYGVGFIIGYTGLKSVEFIIKKWKIKQENNKN